jgi:hypothetical protein
VSGKRRFLGDGDRLDDADTIVIRGGHLDDGVDALVACEHRSWRNPYQEP